MNAGQSASHFLCMEMTRVQAYASDTQRDSDLKWSKGHGRIKAMPCNKGKTNTCYPRREVAWTLAPRVIKSLMRGLENLSSPFQVAGVCPTRTVTGRGGGDAAKHHWQMRRRCE